MIDGGKTLATFSAIASAAKQSRVFPQMHFWIASLRSQ